MEEQRSEVDTTRPFRSVKEAVAIYGERLLSGDLSSSIPISPYPSSRPFGTTVVPTVRQGRGDAMQVRGCQERGDTMQVRGCHGREDTMQVMRNVQRLEIELEETKQEIMLLKERESEMKVILASLNAEVHRNANELAAIDAKVKGCFRQGASANMNYLPTLAEVLGLGEIESEIEERERRRRKKQAMKEVSMLRRRKPIVPLVWDLIVLARKKKEMDSDGRGQQPNSQLVSGTL